MNITFLTQNKKKNPREEENEQLILRQLEQEESIK